MEDTLTDKNEATAATASLPRVDDEIFPASLPVLVPLEKVIIESMDGSSRVLASVFCDVCRNLEHRKTKGKEIVPYFPRGFVNTGNTCYRNAVLQSLLVTPPLIRLLVALSDNAERLPDSMYAWREVLTLSGELANEPPPPLYTPSVGSSTGSRNTGVDPLTPNAYFVKTFVQFRKKMASLRGEAFHQEEGPRLGSTGAVHPRIPQEDAMDFMTYLLESLNMEIMGDDNTSMYVAAEKEKEDVGWESVSTTKTKVKVKKMVDDESRIDVARWNAATTITRIFYGTLRFTVSYPANKASAKKITNATFQQFFSLKLDITKPMEISGIKGAMKPLSINKPPPQYCSLPPITLDRALECYFQSTMSDDGAIENRRFEQLPQVLMLQLDRFYYDNHRNMQNKIDRDVRYPSTLVLPTNMLSTELVERLQKDASTNMGEEEGKKGSI